MSTDDPEGERIAKVLSRAGIASRRDAERMILDGRVTVNGKVAASPAMNVTPGDRLAVDGVRVAPPEPTRLWLYHKPAGVITTTVDEEGRETVFEGLPAEMPRVMAVGRLDLTSEGLLLLTNDGELKRRLELPATGWLRRYRVRINGTVSEAQLDRLRAGVTVEEVEYAPMEVQFDRQQGANAWLTVGLREGRNREIRRVMDYLGVAVNRLIRVSYGPFQLGEIAPGEVREVPARALRAEPGLLAEPEEQRLTRRVRGAAPVKVKPVRTGPVMRSTKGGPRPGESMPRPAPVAADGPAAGGAAAGGGGMRGKPPRAGRTAARPGWGAGKAAAVAAAREGGNGPVAADGPAADGPAAGGGGMRGKPPRAGRTAERPGWGAGKAAAVAAARDAGDAPRKPRSAGFKSHKAAGAEAGPKPAGGRSAGFRSHRPAEGEAAGEAGGRKTAGGKTFARRAPEAGGTGGGARAPTRKAWGGKPAGAAPRGDGPRAGGGGSVPRGPREEAGGERPRKPRAGAPAGGGRGAKAVGAGPRGPRIEAGGERPRGSGGKPRAVAGDRVSASPAGGKQGPRKPRHTSRSAGSVPTGGAVGGKAAGGGARGQAGGGASTRPPRKDGPAPPGRGPAGGRKPGR